MIRRADADDAHAIASLVAELEPEFLISEIDPVERAERMRALIHSGDNVHFVAEADGNIVGELAVALAGPGPASLGGGVLPRRRRQGIGSALLAEATAWAAANDVHKLVAEVFPHNEPALAFLATHGFEQEGRLRRHYSRADGDVWDVVVLGRVLA